MGIIQSIFCSISFCIERILTWVCCAVVLIMLLFTIVLIMIYGITVGYHYAQKELASFAEKSKPGGQYSVQRSSGVVSVPPIRSSDLEEYRAIEKENVADVVVTDFTDLEMYRTKKLSGASPLFWDTGETLPSTVQEENGLEYELSTDLSPHEKDLARRLLGRVRRSRNNSTFKKNDFLGKMLRLT